MADTRCQNECEAWVRAKWLPASYGQPFSEKRVRLTSGGEFKFDAVSEDGSLVVSISTSRAVTSGGKRGVGKLMKLRGDMLFHSMAVGRRQIMVLTESCMFDACLAEQAKGRVPRGIEFVHVKLPEDLSARLAVSRDRSSLEVQPRAMSPAT